MTGHEEHTLSSEGSFTHEETAAEALSVVSARQNLVGLHSPDPQDKWSDEIGPKVKRPALRYASYLAIGLASFLLFLYMTFPYGILKELLTAKISQSLVASGIPMRVSIGKMAPYWFTGVSIKNLSLSQMASSETKLTFSEVKARLNILPLFIGRISLSSEISQGSGQVSAHVSIPLLAALNGGTPKEIVADFKSFSLDAFFQQGFAYAKNSKETAMLLLQPILAKSSAGGQLSGRISFLNNDPNNPSTGISDVKLSLLKGYLHIDDNTLQIPRQNFNTAKFSVHMENNHIHIDQSTQFAAEDLDINLGGKVNLNGPNGQPDADLKLILKMGGQIEKNLGLILPNVLRCPPLKNGHLHVRLQGPLSNMACRPSE